MGRSRFVICKGYEIHFTEWGDSQSPALVMWHGLARTGRDFDALAAAMSSHFWVICPDTLGRGLSQWAKNPENDYCYKSYGSIVASLLDQLGIQNFGWIGTSMGGSLGIDLAGGLFKGRINRLVINDIGPELPAEAAKRIATYVGNPPVFETIGELEKWLRTNYLPFGENPEVYWRTMTDTSYRRTDDGEVTVHYDPHIVSQFTLHRGDLDQWEAYRKINCPTLLLRGEFSDVLPKEMAMLMTQIGPRAHMENIRGFGHAPTLGTSCEIESIRAFLNQ